MSYMVATRRTPEFYISLSIDLSRIYIYIYIWELKKFLYGKGKQISLITVRILGITDRIKSFTSKTWKFYTHIRYSIDITGDVYRLDEFILGTIDEMV
jgi:hypothetical protein